MKRFPQTNITYLLLITFFLSVTFFACKKEDEKVPGFIPETCEPNSYCFLRQGETSVDSYYSWVSLNQLDEFTEAMENIDGGASVSTGALSGYLNNFGTYIFTPDETVWFSYYSGTANHQEVDFRSVIKPERISHYSSIFSQYAQDSNIEAYAEEGEAGFAFGVENPNDRFLVNSNGRQYKTFIQSSLIADRYFYDIQENIFQYVLNADTGYVQIDTVNYSNNEKRWDNLFGYLDIPENLSFDSEDIRYLAEMSNYLDPVLGTNSALTEPLLEGRAAIYYSDVVSVENLIPELQLTLHRVAAGSIIRYLKNAVDAESDFAERSKQMSLAVGLAQALNYSNEELKVSESSISSLVLILGENLYQTTNEDLQEAINWVVNNSAISAVEALNI